MTAVIDVRALLASPGSSRPVRLDEPVEGLATELARVPEDRPVRGDLLLENVIEGLLVSGPLSGVMTLSCARCLKPFEGAFTLEVHELFVAGATGQDDEYPVEDGSIDLEPMIRDAVLLAMPFAPLCGFQCLGLCERCGGDRNMGECSCPAETDPRWSPLLDLNLTIDD